MKIKKAQAYLQKQEGVWELEFKKNQRRKKKEKIIERCKIN